MRERGIFQFTAGLIVAALLPAVPARATHTVAPSQLEINWNSGSGSGSNPDERAATEALLQVNHAQTQVSRALLALQREFENSTDYQNALTAVQVAHAEFVAARSSALAKLHSSAEYKSAQIEIWKAQQQLDADQGKRTNELAGQLLRRRAALTTMESDLIENDKTIRQARFKLIDAVAQVAAMKRSFIDSIRSNPQWREARTQLEEARSRLAAIGD